MRLVIEGSSRTWLPLGTRGRRPHAGGYRPGVPSPEPAPAPVPTPVPTPVPAVRLVVVPGLGLDARSWEPVLRRLAVPSGVRPVPGYGRPAVRRADLSPATLGEALGHGLRGGPPTVLVGHSSGCQVAAHAARVAGPAVVGVVLVGPTTDPRADGWTSLVQRWLRTAAHEDPRQVPSLVGQYRRTGLGSMARAMQAARRDDVRIPLRAQGAPLLVVRGPHDRICPADWAASLGGRCTTLPAGGHMVPITRGADVAAALAAFVAEVSARHA